MNNVQTWKDTRVGNLSKKKRHTMKDPVEKIIRVTDNKLCVFVAMSIFKFTTKTIQNKIAVPIDHKSYIS